MSNADTKFTWSTEYEYEDCEGNRWSFVTDDNDKNGGRQIKIARKGDHRWVYRNGRVFTNKMNHRDIIAQHPIAPPAAEPVPQWCRDAAKSIGSAGLLGLSYFSDEAVARDVATIIARHAPKAEPQHGVEDVSQLRSLVRHCWVHTAYDNCGYAKMDEDERALFDSIINNDEDESEQPAPRYACSKLAAVGDRVRYRIDTDHVTAGYMTVEAIVSGQIVHTIGRDGVQRSCNAKHLEFVPEIPPAGATVWPRYFRWIDVTGGANYRCESQSKRPILVRSGGRSEVPSDDFANIDELIAYGNVIETDAEGNALTQPIEQQQVSGVEVMQGTISNARAFNRALTQSEIETLYADPNARIEGEVPVKVGGVERIRMWDDESAATYTEVVTAADHDAAIAELQRKLQIREAEIGIGGSPPPYPTWMQQVADRDATIAELRADRQYCFDQMKASDTRAEAAEAKCLRLVGEAIARAEKADEKCAEYRDTFDATNNMRLNEVRLRHQIQKRADDLTAQLAAANERLVSVDNSPYVRCLEGDGKPYVLRVGMSMRNWDGSQSNHPHWHIQRLTWSEYGGPFSSPEKANEYLGGMLERNPNYYTTIAGIAALAKPSAEVVE